MKANNYFLIQEGSYFADHSPAYLIIQDTQNWKVFYADGRVGMPFKWYTEPSNEPATIPAACIPVEIDVLKLKQYFFQDAQVLKWRNFTKRFKEKHALNMIMDGPSLEASWYVEGKKLIDVWYYFGMLDSEALHPHFHRASKMLRYLQTHGTLTKV